MWTLIPLCPKSSVSVFLYVTSPPLLCRIITAALLRFISARLLNREHQGRQVWSSSPPSRRLYFASPPLQLSLPFLSATIVALIHHDCNQWQNLLRAKVAIVPPHICSRTAPVHTETHVDDRRSIAQHPSAIGLLVPSPSYTSTIFFNCCLCSSFSKLTLQVDTTGSIWVIFRCIRWVWY